MKLKKYDEIIHYIGEKQLTFSAVTNSTNWFRNLATVSRVTSPVLAKSATNVIYKVYVSGIK